MKYTKSNIIGTPLFMLNKKTGEIHSGSFINGLTKHESRDMDNVKKFQVKDDNNVDWILFCVEKLFLRRIDLIFKDIKTFKKNPTDIKYEIEGGYRTYKDGRCDNTHSEGMGEFLIFSSLEKLNVVLKEIILPKLIKEDIKRANDLMEGYMGVADRLGRLETQLKSL